MRTLIVEDAGSLGRGLARALVAALVICGAGCASTETAPSTVSKAVATPCPTSMPDKPVFPADRLTGDEDIWTLATTLWADHKERKAYEIKLEVRLQGCIEPAPP